MFPDLQWLASVIERANANGVVRAGAVGWQGVVGLVLEAEPDTPGRRDLFIRMVARDGRWHAGGVGDESGLVDDAAFVLRMAWSLGIRLIRGEFDPEVDPVKALVQGQIVFCGVLPSPIHLGSWLTAVCGVIAAPGPPVVPGPMPTGSTGASGPAGGARDDLPKTQFVASGAARIAFSMFGQGPIDVVLVPGLFSHLELAWAEPALARFLTGLSGFARTILFDKRGMGLSERDPRLCAGTLQERVDDLAAVLDAAGSTRAALIGTSEGGPPALVYAAGCPERVSALILINGSARLAAAPDYPQGLPESAVRASFEALTDGWGSGVGLEMMAPSMVGDVRFRRWWAAVQAAASTPEGIAACLPMNLTVDVRHVLPQIRVPALVLHRTNDLVLPVGCGRDTARHIPGARFCELPGPDHLFWLGDQAPILAAIRNLLAGTLDAGTLGTGSLEEGAVIDTRSPRSRQPGRGDAGQRAGRATPARPATGWSALTHAELDVVRLVVDGLTNKEIGRRLHVSPRTVQTHLAHVFDKLQLRRRSELAVLASQRLPDRPT